MSTLHISDTSFQPLCISLWVGSILLNMYLYLGSLHKVSAHCLLLLNLSPSTGCSVKHSQFSSVINCFLVIVPPLLSVFNIGSGLAYQIYLMFQCTKASTSSITSHINNTCAQILKCVTHAISFKGNHYNPTLVTFKILI